MLLLPAACCCLLLLPWLPYPGGTYVRYKGYVTRFTTLKNKKPK
jgi:hypothetical protein